jgi:hypothetical protein
VRKVLWLFAAIVLLLVGLEDSVSRQLEGQLKSITGKLRQ